ncbi:hypothetical protein ACX84Z_27580 [Burkholderia pseudomallei]
MHDFVDDGMQRGTDRRGEDRGARFGFVMHGVGAAQARRLSRNGRPPDYYFSLQPAVSSLEKVCVLLSSRAAAIACGSAMGSIVIGRDRALSGASDETGGIGELGDIRNVAKSRRSTRSP